MSHFFKRFLFCFTLLLVLGSAFKELIGSSFKSDSQIELFAKDFDNEIEEPDNEKGEEEDNSKIEICFVDYCSDVLKLFLIDLTSVKKYKQMNNQYFYIFSYIPIQPPKI